MLVSSCLYALFSSFSAASKLKRHWPSKNDTTFGLLHKPHTATKRRHFGKSQTGRPRTNDAVFHFTVSPSPSRLLLPATRSPWRTVNGRFSHHTTLPPPPIVCSIFSTCTALLTSIFFFFENKDRSILTFPFSFLLRTSSTSHAYF